MLNTVNESGVVSYGDQLVKIEEPKSIFAENKCKITSLVILLVLLTCYSIATISTPACPGEESWF